MLFCCWTGSLCSKHFCSECACCVCLLFWFGEIPRPVKFVCYNYTVELLHFPPQIIVELHVLNQFGALLFGLLTSCFSLHDVTARVHAQGTPLTNGVCVIWALLWMPCSVALSPAKRRFPTCSTLKTDRRQNLQRSFQTKLNCDPIVCVGL